MEDKGLMHKRMQKCAKKMRETATWMADYAAGIRDLGDAVEIEAHAKQLKAAAGIVRSWMKFMFPKKKEA
ncbi:MAG: hypothetical protein IKS20_12975 [Victivallales bacterium]|nr:hypothetical protein [Victivallales bacterium]